MAKLPPEERAKDIVSYRIILIFTAALISILLMMPLSRYIGSPYAFSIGYPLVKILIGVGVLALIGGVVIALVQKKKGKPQELYLFRGLDVAVGGFAFAACMFALLKFRSNAVGVLYFALPVICVLAIIYYIYQREFATLSLYAALSALFVYAECYCVTFDHTLGAIEFVLGIALLGAAVIVLDVVAAKHGGKLWGIKFTELKPEVLTSLIFAVVAVLSALAALLFIPRPVILLPVMLAVYLIILVYKTIKLS